MRILGIDPGTGRTGFGLIEGEGSAWRLVDCGLVETPAGAQPADRLMQLHQRITELLAQHRPDQVAVEELYFAKNVTTGLGVAQARGVVLLAIRQAKLPVAEYQPTQVKQSVSAYGGAGKTQVATMVTKLLNLTETPKPDDVTDALAVALCHSGFVRFTR